MSMKLIGLEEVKKYFTGMPRRVEKGLKGVIVKSGNEGVAEWKGRLTLMKAVDTGLLKGSVRVQFSSDFLRAVIGTAVEYAIYVEFGTRRMAPRPAYRLTVASLEISINKDILNMLDKVLAA